MIRLLIADDHPMVRDGLVALFDGAADIHIIGTASNGQEAIDVAEREHADVVLMDLAMPGMDGTEATRVLARTRPDTRVVVLTSFSEHDRILEALDAGAVGYLLKDAEPDELLRGIRAAAAGDAPFSPRAARALLPRASRNPLEHLTERERQVLDLLAAGLTNKVIASRLGIAEKTVKTHLTSIFATLDVHDRVQAALFVQRHTGDR